MQLYRFHLSTNVDRVALALAHKGLAVESVDVDPEDRSSVRKVSGQDLVPVLVDEGRVLIDSMQIVSYLDARHPEPALYPSDPARRAEMEIFIDWFNLVWKVPPNAMEEEMNRPEPDQDKITAWSREMAAHLGRFESMLEGREYLMGDRLSAADIAAFPFLRYALIWPEDDPWLFHAILRDHLPLGDEYPLLTGWIRRLDLLPRA